MRRLVDKEVHELRNLMAKMLGELRADGSFDRMTEVEIAVVLVDGVSEISERHHRRTHLVWMWGDANTYPVPRRKRVVIQVADLSIQVGDPAKRALAKYLDQSNQPVNPDTPPVWSLDNPAIGTLAVAADGTYADFSPVAAGTGVVTCVEHDTDGTVVTSTSTVTVTEVPEPRTGELDWEDVPAPAAP